MRERSCSMEVTWRPEISGRRETFDQSLESPAIFLHFLQTRATLPSCLWGKYEKDFNRTLSGILSIVCRLNREENEDRIKNNQQVKETYSSEFGAILLSRRICLEGLKSIVTWDFRPHLICIPTTHDDEDDEEEAGIKSKHVQDTHGIRERERGWPRPSLSICLSSEKNLEKTWRDFLLWITFSLYIFSIFLSSSPSINILALFLF